MPGVQIFSDKKFFVLQRVPCRTSMIDDIERHGGRLVKLEVQADYVIADHMRRDAPSGSLSYTFIEAAIKAGVVPDENEHRASAAAVVAAHPSSSRPLVGASGISRPVKTTRTPFTADDDLVLWNWIRIYQVQGASLQGNEIYKRLEEHNPRHTFQSWRDRYVKHLRHQNPPAFVVAATPPTPPSEPLAPPSTGGKRRAEPGTSQSRANHNTQGKALRVVRRDDELKRFPPGFTKDDLENVLEEAHSIEEIPLKSWDSAWEKWAETFDHHSAKEWESFYRNYARKEYKKRQIAEERTTKATNDSRRSSQRPNPDIAQLDGTVFSHETESAEPVQVSSRSRPFIAPPSNQQATESQSTQARSGPPKREWPSSLDNALDDAKRQRLENLKTLQSFRSQSQRHSTDTTSVRQASARNHESFPTSTPGRLQTAVANTRTGVETRKDSAPGAVPKTRGSLSSIKSEARSQIETMGLGSREASVSKSAMENKGRVSRSDVQGSPTAMASIKLQERTPLAVLVQKSREFIRQRSHESLSTRSPQQAHDMEASQFTSSPPHMPALTEENLAQMQAQHRQRQSMRAKDISEDDADKDQTEYAEVLHSLLPDTMTGMVLPISRSQLSRDIDEEIPESESDQFQNGSDQSASASPELGSSTSVPVRRQFLPSEASEVKLNSLHGVPEIALETLKRRGNAFAHMSPQPTRRLGSRNAFAENTSGARVHRALLPSLSPGMDPETHDPATSESGIVSQSVELLDLDLPEPEGGFYNHMSSQASDPPIPVDDPFDDGFLPSRNQTTETQAILEAETQALDLDLPDVPDVLDMSDSVSAREGSSNTARRQSNYFRHNPRPVSAIPKSFGGDAGALRAYIQAKKQLGHEEQHVIEALEATSMQTRLAEIALGFLSKGRGLPKALSGIWTKQDDEDLECSDAARIEGLERKHGSRGVNERIQYLGVHRAVELAARVP